MRKYWAFYKAGLGKMFVYRGPMFLWFFGNLVSVATMVAVWLSSDSRGLIGGYTRNGLITYAVIAAFLPWIINWNPFSAVAREIKDGSIAVKILLKPVSYYFERLAWELAWHTVSIFIGLGIGFIFVMIFYHYLVFSLTLDSFLLSALTVFLGGILQFNMGMCLALLAFWFTSVEPVSSLKWMAIAILGGSSIPISFIPGAFQSLIKILPFRYMFSFPLEIILGRVSGTDVYIGMLIGALWLFIFAGIYRIMWNQGLKSYISVGQ